MHPVVLYSMMFIIYLVVLKNPDKFQGKVLVLQSINENQRLDGCRLRRDGSLPFTFQNGACAVYYDPNMGKEVVLLCFDDDANLSDNTKDAKVCYE